MAEWNGLVARSIAGLMWCGDMVARTMSQSASALQLNVPPYPFHYAMTTRAGCDCVAHALQGLTEIDPEVTVTSIDGLGAFDMISRGAMLQGLRRVSGAALLFHTHVLRSEL